MTISIHGPFAQYNNPDLPGIICVRDSADRDWYQVVHSLPKTPHAIVVGGDVLGVAPEPSSIGVRDGMTIVTLPDGSPCSTGWTLAGSVLFPPASASLASVKSAASARVDAAAERARMRHITPGYGMQLTYREKLDEAEEVLAMGEPLVASLPSEAIDQNFPILSASIGLEAPTLWGCADLVVNRYRQFAQTAKVIESKRLIAKAAIKAATTVDQVASVEAGLDWSIP